jgi:hypothetical protein
MISLSVRRGTKGGSLELEVAEVATYPAVPQDWREVPYVELFDRAISFLSE